MIAPYLFIAEQLAAALKFDEKITIVRVNSSVNGMSPSKLLEFKRELFRVDKKVLFIFCDASFGKLVSLDPSMLKVFTMILVDEFHLSSVKRMKDFNKRTKNSPS